MDLVSNHVFKESFIAGLQYELREGFSYQYYRMNTDSSFDMSILRARFVEYYLIPKNANRWAGECPKERNDEANR